MDIRYRLLNTDLTLSDIVTEKQNQQKKNTTNQRTTQTFKSSETQE